MFENIAVDHMSDMLIRWRKKISDWKYVGVVIIT